MHKRADHVSSKPLINSAIFNWTLELAHELDIAFIKVNFLINNKRNVSLEVIELRTNSNRVCSLVSGPTFLFECDLPDNELTEEPIPTRQIMLTTVTSEPTTVYLAFLAVAKHYHDCDEPEMPYMLNYESFGNRTLKVYCIEDPDVSTTLNCNRNNQWQGAYPTCRPRLPCKELQAKDFYLVEDIGYKNVLIQNSVNYLINDSIAILTCANHSNQITKLCVNGGWISDGQVCYSNDVQEGSTDTFKLYTAYLARGILMFVVVICGMVVIRLISHVCESVRLLDSRRGSARFSPEIRVPGNTEEESGRSRQTSAYIGLYETLEMEHYEEVVPDTQYDVLNYYDNNELSAAYADVVKTTKL